MSHDPLLTTSDSQLLNLDPSVAETELICHSDIPFEVRNYYIYYTIMLLKITWFYTN